jgi:hypothetical protein
MRCCDWIRRLPGSCRIKWGARLFGGVAPFNGCDRRCHWHVASNFRIVACRFKRRKMKTAAEGGPVSIRPRLTGECESEPFAEFLLDGAFTER